MTDGDMQTLVARCLCGASKHSAKVPKDALPQTAHMCHCDSCRHNNGTLCYSATDWPDAELGDADEAAKTAKTMTSYAFSPRAVTWFCTSCGTRMFWSRTVEPKFLGVATRCLGASEELLKFEDHIYLADSRDSGMSAWLTTVGGQAMKRWPHDEGGTELPLGWTSELQPQQQDVEAADATVQSGGADRNLLHAYCLCKGVDFSLVRPPATLSTDEGAEHERPWYFSDRGGRYRAANCACDSCTLAAGVDVVQWAFVPASSIRLADGGPYHVPFGTLKAYKSSDKVTRYFCGRCGAKVFYTTTSRPEVIDVAVGLMDAASGARAEEWLDWTMDEEIDYTDDAPNRALVEGLTAGWKAWKRQTLAEAGQTQI